MSTPLTAELRAESPPPAGPTGYSIYPYSREALPAILILLQQTLGNSGAVRKTEEFWQWKHHANPFGASYGLYAWDEATAQVAGLRVLMRWTFRATDGTLVQSARAVDTATHPDHQRRGLFSSLTRQAIAELTAQGTDCIFNTPNQKSLPGYLKMGWQVAARWPLYIKPLRPLRMAYRRLRPVATAAKTSFAMHFGAEVLPWDEFIEHFGEQAGEVLAAWERARQQVGLRTLRTVDYLTWRYGGHPHIHYGVYTHTDHRGKLQGFAILRPNVRFGWQETVLTEFCLAQPDRTAGLQLLRSLRHHLHSDYLIAHFAHHTVEADLLRRSHFWPAPRQQIIFTARPLQETAAHLSHAGAWDLTLGDLELF
ncbi:MAG: GNAT family N-acetyltransferase [Caldilineaceae bacterium]|nr:GNAT family N-acetyltransferase [Caldilineaceae bacterium]